MRTAMLLMLIALCSGCADISMPEIEVVPPLTPPPGYDDQIGPVQHHEDKKSGQRRKGPFRREK